MLVLLQTRQAVSQCYCLGSPHPFGETVRMVAEIDFVKKEEVEKKKERRKEGREGERMVGGGFG